MIRITLALLPAMMTPHTDAPLVVEHVDRLEVNHVLERKDALRVVDGAPVLEIQDTERFSALLFWRTHLGRERVITWRWVARSPRHDRQMLMWPMPDEDGWAVEWEERGCLRRVTADEYVETYTHYDREVRDRRHGRRPGLKAPETARAR